MAAPSYTTDLYTITTAETTTGWSAIGGPGIDVGADFSMQGTNCVDRAVSNSERGQLFNFGATITPGADTHFYIWLFLATPGLADSLLNRGLTATIGTSTTAYTQHHVEGKDTYGAVGRVGKCYPIRYVNTTKASPPNYRTNVSTPGANPQYFGGIAKTIGTVKSANLGVDAIRFGSGMYITAGDTSTPATFSGSAEINDNISNRWGVLTYVGGVGFELQGKLAIGQISSSARTPTQSYFSDSGKSILFVNNPHTLTGFNEISVSHQDTVFILSSCAFVGAGTVSPGKITFNDHRTQSTLSSCTFDRIGSSSLQTAVTSSGCSWNLCSDITQSGSNFNECNFTGTKVISNNPARISNSTFTYGATGTHGLEVTTTGSFIFSGNKFVGFGPSGSLSASLFNNSGGQVTMSIQNAGDTPTFRNSAGSSTLISNPVALTINITDSDGAAITSSCEITVVRDSDTSILYAAEDVITGTTQYLYTYATDITAYINVLNVSAYEPKTISPVIIGNTNQTISVQLDDERGKYNNP